MTDTGVLLLHGFAGDNEEIKPLRDDLEQRGYIVACPLLPGHGQTKIELSSTTHRLDRCGGTGLSHLSRNAAGYLQLVFPRRLLAVNLWNFEFSGW